MTAYPHEYEVASGGPEGPAAVSSEGLASLETAPPAQFGGPGDRWSLALEVHLLVPPGLDADRAKRLLEKAEEGCLITRSPVFEPTLAAVETA
jgi:hypothetical protein